MRKQTRFDHFYTIEQSGEIAAINSYKYEGIAGYVYPNDAPYSVPLYRFQHPTVYDHFYTQDRNGEGARFYEFQKTACYLPISKDKSATEFNRLYGHYDHFYTCDPNFEGSTSDGYTHEGAAGYIYRNQEEGTVPLYRWSKTYPAQ